MIITKKNLILFGREVGCYTIKDIVKGYLRKNSLLLDDEKITLSFEDLDRFFKEASASDKEIGKKYGIEKNDTLAIKTILSDKVGDLLENISTALFGNSAYLQIADSAVSYLDIPDEERKLLRYRSLYFTQNLKLTIIPVGQNNGTVLRIDEK